MDKSEAITTAAREFFRSYRNKVFNGTYTWEEVCRRGLKLARYSRTILREEDIPSIVAQLEALHTGWRIQHGKVEGDKGKPSSAVIPSKGRRVIRSTKPDS